MNILFFFTTADLAIFILLSETVWSNCRPVGCMWPTTVFSEALGSIHEKSSNLIFVEKRLRSHLDEVHFHKRNALSVYNFALYIYFVIKLEGLWSCTNPLTRVH